MATALKMSKPKYTTKYGPQEITPLTPFRLFASDMLGTALGLLLLLWCNYCKHLPFHSQMCYSFDAQLCEHLAICTYVIYSIFNLTPPPPPLLLFSPKSRPAFETPWTVALPGQTE